MQVCDLRAGYTRPDPRRLSHSAIDCEYPAFVATAGPGLSIPVQQMDANSEPAHAGGTLGAQANKQPCGICIRDETDCIHAAPFNRGRRLHMATTIRSATCTTEQYVPIDSQAYPELTSQHPVEPIAQGFGLAEMTDRETPSRALPELMTDFQGRYVGLASDVPSLSRIQKRLHW